MDNYYNALVSSGFLSKAKRQINKAAAIIYPPTLPSISEIKGEWMWHFDRNEKKLDFDYLCDELELFSHVIDNLDQLDEEHDVMVLNAFDILIYASPNKKSIKKSVLLDFKEQGMIPYYITKRKVNGQFLRFCFTWTVFPFEPISEN